MLNFDEQQYGSQHNLPTQYRPISQNFGSTPHIPQTYGSPSAYNSRPPSRDPYQQSMQYINEHGQYISQPPPAPYPSSHTPQPIYQRDNQYMGENGTYSYGSQYIGDQYQSNQFMSRPQPPPPPLQSHDYDDYRTIRDHNSPQPGQFYLHESSPQPTQRRTWAQSAAQNAELQQQQQQQIQLDINAWQTQTMPSKIDTRTWKSPGGSSSGSSMSGFMLHQNGGNDYGHQEKSYQNLFPVHSSPQHSRTPSRQTSNVMSNHRVRRNKMVKKKRFRSCGIALH